MPEKIDSVIVGNAGEHYIMCQLLRRGWVAALAPTGVPNMDIIVTDKDSRKLRSISVKTRRDTRRNGGWPMSEKHERIRAEDLFYCFVDFGKEPSAAVCCYVIPSAVVADVLTWTHKAWGLQPGKKGQRLKIEHKMRRVRPDYSHNLTDALKEREPNVYKHVSTRYGQDWLKPYLEAWDRLGLPHRSAF